VKQIKTRAEYVRAGRDARLLCGGVLEHPKRSKLWPILGLPAPGQRDEFGGWTLAVNQSWWGHRAEKATLLYIVGCEPSNLPPYQKAMPFESHVVGTSGRHKDGKRSASRPEITKAEREHTPPQICPLARGAGQALPRVALN
jgi:hypothetical protein